MSRDSDAIARLLPDLLNLLYSAVPSDTLDIWADNELTMPQLIALHVLDASGALTVSGLQARLQLSASATSHMVDRLVAKGFVDRAEDPEDRRQKLVRVTEQGLDLARRVVGARDEQFRAGLLPLPDDLATRLHAALQEAVDHLRAHGAHRCPGLSKSTTS